MGVADGTVLGITKIFDSGLPTERWNLVIVAEGYTAGEIAQFQQDAEDLLDELLETAPFDEDEIACAINVYRLDVVSNESGADDPVCGDEGSDTFVPTYFDATFCVNGLYRLLSGDNTLAQDTVEAVIPYWHQIFVLVNSSIRGGSGGTISWGSRGGFDWRDVFVHELGHSAFNLADEYDYLTGESDEEGQDNYNDGEPAEPNVTAEPDPVLVKWDTCVTAGADVPTHSNPDCSQRNTEPSPVPAGTVGTFEGAFYYHCGAYRPQYRCKMRYELDDFCVVCQDVIRQFYAPFVLPSASGAVTLTTPTVTFNDVPEDITTQRAAVFSVDSCVPVTFVVTSLPDLPEPPFSLASPEIIVASPTGPTPWTARVWFRYTCDAPGTMHSSSVTIQCLETGDVFNVNLSGNCITRPTVAVQLVFDRSASMLDMTDEGLTKETVLKNAASAFAIFLYDDNGVGLNAYDHDPHPILDVQEVGSLGDGLGRDDLITQIGMFSANPGGNTAIGDGIELAKNRLDNAGSYDVKAMLVLTDGIETADKRVADVADTVVNQRVFAIGLGTASQIQPATLNALTNGTGGYLLMTGNLSPDERFLLDKYYLQILAGVNNNDIIIDPEGYLAPGNTIRIPFNVIESDIEITGVLLTPAPFAMRPFALETPEGQVINESFASSEPTVEFRLGSRTVFIRASLPQVINDEIARSGRWHLILNLEDKYYRRYLSTLESDRQKYNETVAHGVRYSANVYTYSNLRLRARASQNSYEPGATITVSAILTEYDVPFAGFANVTAQLRRPDNIQELLVLDESSPGIFEVKIIADIPGIYRFRILINGRTTREEPFTRETTVTVPIWLRGDTPPNRPDGNIDRDWLCRVVTCLVSNGAFDAKDCEKSATWIDPEVIQKCFCQRVALEGRT